jgi:hypothetical protein
MGVFERLPSLVWARDERYSFSGRAPELPRVIPSKFPPSHVFYSLVTLIVERVQPRAS